MASHSLQPCDLVVARLQVLAVLKTKIYRTNPYMEEKHEGNYLS
jgi:hypothetical protein